MTNNIYVGHYCGKCNHFPRIIPHIFVNTRPDKFFEEIISNKIHYMRNNPEYFYIRKNAFFSGLYIMK